MWVIVREIIDTPEHVSSDLSVLRLRDGDVVADQQNLLILAFRQSVCGGDECCAQSDPGGTRPQCLHKLASVGFHGVQILLATGNSEIPFGPVPAALIV